ncbi:MAG: M23 family metallopeptidase [Chitinivibrionales bacterium]|nr:M23 family metallopeptidase [Chitinivibrionales bacterium]
MASGKKLIVIVPPDGKQVRSIRLRSALIVIVCLLFLGGFGGYFIPLSSTTVNAVRQTEKNNLTQQNQQLAEGSREAFKLSNLLRKDIKLLEKKIGQLKGEGALKSTSAAPKHLSFPFIGTKSSPPDNIDEICARNESIITHLTAVLTRSPAILNSIPVNYPVTNCRDIAMPFGRFPDPFTNTTKWHYGDDFVAETETPVIATAAGTVARVENDRVWGKRIFITHGFGFTTVYAHLGTVSVFVGKKVNKGDCVATVGITGMTTGPHLHYEIWRNGRPLNPEDYYFPDVDTFFTASSAG